MSCGGGDELLCFFPTMCKKLRVGNLGMGTVELLTMTGIAPEALLLAPVHNS